MAVVLRVRAREGSSSIAYRLGNDAPGGSGWLSAASSPCVGSGTAARFAALHQAAPCFGAPGSNEVTLNRYGRSNRLYRYDHRVQLVQ